jgi:hypothetical protein
LQLLPNNVKGFLIASIIAYRWGLIMADFIENFVQPWGIPTWHIATLSADQVARTYQRIIDILNQEISPQSAFDEVVRDYLIARMTEQMQVTTIFEPKWAWMVTANGNCDTFDTATIDLDREGKQGVNDIRVTLGLTSPVAVNVSVKITVTAKVTPGKNHGYGNCSEYLTAALDKEFKEREAHNKREREAQERFREALKRYREKIREKAPLSDEEIRELTPPKFEEPEHPPSDPWRDIRGYVPQISAKQGRFKFRPFVVGWIMVLEMDIAGAVVKVGVSYTIQDLLVHIYTVRTTCCPPLAQ